MLTRKQIWRRTHLKKRPLSRAVAPEEDANEQSPDIMLQEASSSQSPSPPKLKSALSSGNLSGMEKRIRNSRVVRFSATVHVLLIPSRFELLAHCINIYFTSEDYQQFKRDAVNEIREVARFYNIPVKQAMNYLYQPQGALPRAPTPVDLTDDSRSHDENSSAGSSPIGSHDSAKSAMDSDLHFITKAKTDVELNASDQPQATDGSRRIPTRTTTSAPSRQNQIWAVQWKKQASS
jgi:hypothetical protein